MKLQRIFKESYIGTLKNNIKVSNYLGESFPYDENMVKVLANVYQPEGILEKLDPEDELKTAIALYEAYEDISPLIASSDAFWFYLTHVDLFPYVQQRWKIDLDKEEAKQIKFIQDHWFRNSDGTIGTTLMGSWWSIYCSVDSGRSDKYELTRILFRQEEFRRKRLGGSSLFRNREATIGILEFLKENPDILEGSFFESKAIYITRYLNRLGGVRNLSALDRNYFKNLLQTKKPIMMTLRKREEILNNDEILSL